jgi:hypothetical protein
MKARDVFRKLDLQLRPDPSRTVIRPFDFAYPDAFNDDRPSRVQSVAKRLMDLDADTRDRMRMLLCEPMQQRNPGTAVAASNYGSNAQLTRRMKEASR